MNEMVSVEKTLVEDLMKDRLTFYPEFQNYTIKYYIEVCNNLLPKLEVYIIDNITNEEKTFHFSALQIMAFIYSKINK